MDLSCFIFGDWGDTGSISMKMAEENSYYRDSVMFRFSKNGTCGEENREKHLKNMTYLADERQWPEAQYGLAFMLSFGELLGMKTVTISYQDYYSEERHFSLNLSNFDGKYLDPEKSYQLLKSAAEKGEIGVPGALGVLDAQGYLSYLYLTGKWGQVTVSPDIEQSMYWLKRYAQSLERRDIEFGRKTGRASFYDWRWDYFIAKRYLEGAGGLPKDAKKGLAHLTKAAEGGVEIVMIELSALLACSPEVRDVALAKEWLDKAELEYLRDVSLSYSTITVEPSSRENYFKEMSATVNECLSAHDTQES